MPNKFGLDVIVAAVVGNLKGASVDEHEPIKSNNDAAVVVATLAPLFAAAPDPVFLTAPPIVNESE